MMALFFHSFDVDYLITLKESVKIAEEALRDVGVRKGTNPPSLRLRVHSESEDRPYDTVFTTYSGGSRASGAIGARVASVLRQGERRGLPHPPHNPFQVELTLLYEVDTASLLGVMAYRPRHVQGRADLRTPTASLVGLNHLARADATRVGIYGSGRQAWSTFMGVSELRRIESAKVYSPTRAHREIFAEKMTEVTGVPTEAVDSPREAARNVDIILCMTNTGADHPSSGPVLDGSWLEEGQCIVSAIGGNIEAARSGPPRREIDDETLKRCSRIVVLSKEHAIASRQGDLYWPVQSGIITWENVVDVSDVLSGRVVGRTNDKEIVLYKNNGGQGIIDLALAKRCYDLARELGKGCEMEIRPPPGAESSGRWEERRYRP
jgi:ornithine cyclodeaminase/alanine dehydrogenase